MKNIVFLLKAFFVLALCMSSVEGISQIKVFSNGNTAVGPAGATPVWPLQVNGLADIKGKWLDVGKDSGSETSRIRLGFGRGSDGGSAFDLISDDSNYPVYGFRFVRFADGRTQTIHRGVQPFDFRTNEAANINFFTTNAFRMRVTAAGDLGVGTGTPNSKLHVAGDISYAGGILVSDKRLKTNIQRYTSGLDELMNVKSYTYNYNGMAEIDSDKLQFGVMAQEFQQVEPDAVTSWKYNETDYETDEVLSSEDYLAVNPASIQYMVVNAVQEQQEIIESQQNQIEDLNQKIDDLSAKLELLLESNTSLHINDTDKGALSQNYPNPFNENTAIGYYIPESAKNSEIRFFDITGKLIETKEIRELGKGEMDVEITSNTSGVYSYQLVIDNIVVDTKKMTLTK